MSNFQRKKNLALPLSLHLVTPCQNGTFKISDPSSFGVRKNIPSDNLFETLFAPIKVIMIREFKKE